MYVCIVIIKKYSPLYDTIQSGNESDYPEPSDLMFSFKEMTREMQTNFPTITNNQQCDVKQLESVKIHQTTDVNVVLCYKVEKGLTVQGGDIIISKDNEYG